MKPCTKTLVAALLMLGGTAAFAQQSAPAAERRPQARFEERFKAADTDQDGLLSKQEAEKGMPALAKHFDALDTNKDGKLSMDEIKAGFAKMHRPPHHAPKCAAPNHHMEGMPLTRDEVVAHTQKMLADFDAADTDKDGKLSQDELKAWREQRRAEFEQNCKPPAPKQ